MNKSIWLARLLYHHKEGLTKQEILNAWADEDDYGRPMATSTFYDNRGYLESRFGMRIECRNGRYRLTTEVPDSEALLRQLLDDSSETNDKGEREPGKEWLTPLADAVANNKHVEVGYAPLDKAPYTTTLSPYFIRRIRGHCYVVAKSSRHREIRNFAIDRITQLTPLHTTFRRPSDLNASHWFATSFGAFAAHATSAGLFQEPPAPLFATRGTDEQRRIVLPLRHRHHSRFHRHAAYPRCRNTHCFTRFAPTPHRAQGASHR